MNGAAPADLFDAHYYATSCGGKYERNEAWLAAFGRIAERIIADIGPHTVLDAGCALGLLVEALRIRGITAFGRDISSFAIGNAHPSIAAYCELGSITDPFPQRYDLIVSIEVLEHMPEVESRAAVANLCRYSDDILFSSTPFDYKEPSHFNVQPPEYWAELFAQQGFYRDVDYDASYITEWAVRFRRRDDPLHRIIRDYERGYWILYKENQDLRNLALENFRALEDLPGFGIMRGLRRFRLRLAPPLSSRDQILQSALQILRARDLLTLQTQGRRIRQEVRQQMDVVPRETWRRLSHPAYRWHRNPILIVDEAPFPQVVAPHVAQTDVVVCVHNALDDVRGCLAAVGAHTSDPYRLIIVDDGSDAETQGYLAELAECGNVHLIHNEQARGYTRAANQGLAASTADFVVLLNSDTIVGPSWLDRLVACAQADQRVGLVGPLSNYATWQSVPQVIENGEWANNPLPDGFAAADMAEAVDRFSARLYPRVPFLNGFCLLIRREVIDRVGVFDEENFGVGYGEENDYCLRARAAGWDLAVADDTYVYHAGSRSYSHEKRRALSEAANDTLKRKHGAQIVQRGVEFLANDRVLDGVRAHVGVAPEQHTLMHRARQNYAGLRLLWLLPVASPGGGGAVVAAKASIMRDMGIDAAIFNLAENREAFERNYPTLGVPVIYGPPEEVTQVGARYDAAVATANFSAQWLLPLAAQAPKTRLGYLIQDFEPYFFPPGSPDYNLALASYSIVPQMRRLATTRWVQDEVVKNTGMECSLVGGCYNTELFRPRPRSLPEWPERPLRIAAMVRPGSPYRAARLTMEVLRAVARRFRNQVDIRLFGVDPENEAFVKLPHDFRWRIAGAINQRQVAMFLNDADIFVDFSTFQALGITAQEAMSCGAAVIVPQSGGANTFARHEHNCLMVDTSSGEACTAALTRLLQDHSLRQRLQHTGMHEVCAYHPELPTYNILQALFA